MKIIDILKKLESRCKDDGIPVKDNNLIQDAEKKLGVHFSESFIAFLKKFGGALLEGHVIYGLISSDQSSFLSETIIERTKFFKETQKWPDIENWYIVSDDGSGNPIGVDPEGKVWLSDHDAGFEQIKLADSFEEFLYKLYTETLYE